MIPEWLVPTILTIITAATPLVFAAVGEAVAEKSGVNKTPMVGIELDLIEHQ